VNTTVSGSQQSANTQDTELQAGLASKLVFAASNIEVDCSASEYVLDIALEQSWNNRSHVVPVSAARARLRLSTARSSTIAQMVSPVMTRRTV
jgi:hypothetical protein